MNATDRQYADLVRKITDTGFDRPDRTGTGTRAIFGHQMRYDLADGFPILTTKKVHLKSIIHELLWFLKGETNIAYLKEHGVSIWDEWADEDGNLGPVYGAQWRRWIGKDGIEIDQIVNLINTLRTSPYSRRMLVSAWNPSEVDQMALPPCHALWQCAVLDGRLHLQLFQRSADVGLGLPFNVASYALLAMMLAQVTGLQPGEFIHTLGDAHIYSNHMDKLLSQIERTPRDLPRMEINPEVRDIFSFTYDDFALSGYDAHPHISLPVAV